MDLGFTEFVVAARAISAPDHWAVVVRKFFDPFGR
jgi:hypothetical protein